MLEFIETILTSDIAKLTLAFLISLPIAYNREKSTQIMGLRTFPLVAIGSCGIVLIGRTFIDLSAGDSHARIIQGIIAGLGFIGGGAILKGDEKVRGTASAASIWTTGAVGIATAYARYDIAIFLSFVNFFILKVFTQVKATLAELESDSDF